MLTHPAGSSDSSTDAVEGAAACTIAAPPGAQEGAAMRFPYDAYAEGPLPPFTPHDTFERSVLNSAEHGEDVQREQLLHALLVGLPRPLTPPERQAAAEDPGRPPRVYAPASARVSKEPLPWDAEILEAGRHHTITAEAALHPGDRSDPAELR